MRVLVTGSREATDKERIYHELEYLWVQWFTEADVDDTDPEFVVVHGGASGADALAAQWCHDARELQGLVQEVHPAQWGRYGKALAGGIRNGEMVRAGADIVLAFFQPGAANRGTQNCVNQARLAGLDVKEIWL